MKMTSIILTFLFSLSAFASHTSGFCEKEAIRKAIDTAPGSDPSSFAEVVSIKLTKTRKLNSGATLEEYYVQTEDQGGTATSIIKFEVKEVSSAMDEVLRIKCVFRSQEWVE